MNVTVKMSDGNLYPLWESNTLRGQARDLWCSAAVSTPCSEVLMSTPQCSICLSVLGRQSQVLIRYTFIGLNHTYQCLGLNLSGYILFCRYFYKRLVKPCCHGQSLFSRRQMLNAPWLPCTPRLKAHCFLPAGNAARLLLPTCQMPPQMSKPREQAASEKLLWLSQADSVAPCPWGFFFMVTLLFQH